MQTLPIELVIEIITLEKKQQQHQTTRLLWIPGTIYEHETCSIKLSYKVSGTSDY